MRQFLALIPYNLAMIVLGLVEFVKWLLFLLHKFTIQAFSKKARRHAKLDVAWGQKFGVLPKPIPSHIKNKSILIHCASMGEVTLSIGLIKKLLAEHPEHFIVVTTNTLTGKSQLKRKLGDFMGTRVFHTYLPLDLPWSMWRLLNAVKPLATLIVEVELWPNLIRRCKAKKIPVVIVNARMTKKTQAGYQRFGWIAKPMIQSLNRVLARNNDDFEGYRALGLEADKIDVLGNLKFDIDLPDLNKARALRSSMNIDDRKVLIAGSTHLDEEEIIVRVYNKLKPQHPELFLIVVPRHPERFHQVLEYLIVQDLRIAQMSLDDEIKDKTDVLLVDKMGELQNLYGVSDIAFVGGSIVEKGGHNPLEASAYSKPVIMGPHIYNNTEVCEELVQRGGLVITGCEKELLETVDSWLTDKELQSQAGKQGLAAIEEHTELTNQITQKVYELIR
jgi:3-deoxy-D-manno-octulosonic-acid transferase